MSVGRNDPCPCGSGKKYKKCCLNKKEEKQTEVSKKDKFQQMKQSLFVKLQSFLDQTASFEQMQQWRFQFKQRTKGLINKDEEEGYFTFWLFFIESIHDNKSLIDLFIDKQSNRLTLDERERLNVWKSLEPRMLQAIDRSAEDVYFQDMLTGEVFPIKGDEDNVPFFIPWMSTVGFVEPLENAYHFIGVRPNGSPNDMKDAIMFVNKESVKEKTDKNKLFNENYPEVLAEFLKKSRHSKQSEEIVEYSKMYTVNDLEAVALHIQQLPNCQLNEWTDENKEVVWTGNHRVYDDNAIKGGIEVADVYGQITMRNDELILKTIDQEHMTELEEMLQPIVSSMTFESDEKRIIGLSSETGKNVITSAPEDALPHFSFYAQHDLLKEIDQVQDDLNGLSVQQLMNQEKKFDVEMWLRQMEYGMYRTALARFNEVSVTMDFNSVRKLLHMPLSPFVTGGASRETAVRYVEYKHTGHELLEKQLPILEDLGFTPDTLAQFFTADFIYFYEEKQQSLSEEELRTYRENLIMLRELLQQKDVSSWRDCTISLWREIILVDYSEVSGMIDDESRDQFVGTIKELLNWMDKESNTSYFYRTLLFLEQY
ncbi:MAG TPA: SEC-C metal-binding domain-containing protein [Bacillota bacterium]|nr:SEC-C metal-binding domain-containing protein [Bacillota bacterium]